MWSELAKKLKTPDEITQTDIVKGWETGGTLKYNPELFDGGKIDFNLYQTEKGKKQLEQQAYDKFTQMGESNAALLAGANAEYKYAINKNPEIEKQFAQYGDKAAMMYSKTKNHSIIMSAISPQFHSIKEKEKPEKLTESEKERMIEPDNENTYNVSGLNLKTTVNIPLDKDKPTENVKTFNATLKSYNYDKGIATVVISEPGYLGKTQLSEHDIPIDQIKPLIKNKRIIEKKGYSTKNMSVKEEENEPYPGAWQKIKKK